MNLLPIALLVSCACQAPVPSLGATASARSAASDLDSLQQVYDLSIVGQRTQSGSLYDYVFPILSSQDYEYGYEYDDDIDFAQSLLLSLFEPEFESEGVSVEEIGGYRLAVTASRALHQRIESTLEEIDAIVSSRVELELCCLRLAPDARLAAGLLSDAEAGALIEAAAREGGLERMRLRLGAGLPAALEVGREQTFTADYDAEVAEGIYGHDPVNFSILMGSRITARIAQGRGGLFLALSLRRASPLGDLRVNEVERGSMFLAQDKFTRQTDTLRHETQAVLGRSLALNAFLPEGKALVGVLGHERSGLREAVVVRRISGKLPVWTRLAGGPGASSLTVLDVTRWSPPVVYGGVRAAIQVRRGQMPRFSPDDDGVVQSCSASDEERDGESEIVGAIMRSGLELDDSLGGWPRLAVAFDEAAGDVAGRVASFEPEQRDVVVDLQLRRAGASIARVSLPLLAGHASDAIICSEDLLVVEAEIDVAKYACVEDPVVGTLLEGLLVTLRPDFTPSGEIALRVFGAGIAVDGPVRTFDSEVRGMGQIQSVPQRYLYVDEDLRFPAGGGATAVQLGDSAAGLWIDVSLRVP